MRKKLTLHDVQQAKGKKQFTEIFTMDEDEARAAETAGIDMIVTSLATAERIRRAAPTVFLTAGLGIYDPEITSEDQSIKAGFMALNRGADAVYTGMSIACVRAMAREKIPVVGHVGYVPYRASWFGGARAVGKTAAEAVRVHRATMEYEDAGAVAVEMEIVPEKVATEISRRTRLTVISMGSGAGCDAQYLFACDVLGTNPGHVPRHAKQYANLKEELARLQRLREEAFRAFHTEVNSGVYPAAAHNLKITDGEFESFLEQLG